MTNFKKDDFASNASSAKDMFNKRTTYRDEVYPSDKPYPVDLRENILYGKVDQDGRPIYLSESNLKQLKSGGKGTIFALDFVADAFDEFQFEFKRARGQGLLEMTNSVLVDLKPQKGWESINILHHEMVTVAYDSFVGLFLKQGSKMNEVLTFDDFLSSFGGFALSAVSSGAVLTRSGFVLSNFCPLTTSGLIIDLAKINHGEDFLKYKVLSDPNFDFYRNAALRSGFLIDKNYPMRLVANIYSQELQQNFKKYGIPENVNAVEPLFESYFYLAEDNDYELFKKYLVQMFNSLVTTQPFIVEERVISGKTVLNVKDRVRIPELIKRDEQILALYAKVRIKESSLNWSAQKIEAEINNTLQTQFKLDTPSAVRYINQQIAISNPR